MKETDLKRLQEQGLYQSYSIYPRLFDHVKSGRKDVEVRQDSPKFVRLKDGATVTVWTTSSPGVQFAEDVEWVNRQVVHIRRYPNVDTLLVYEDPERITPGESKSVIRDFFANATNELVVFEYVQPSAKEPME